MTMRMISRLAADRSLHTHLKSRPRLLHGAGCRRSDGTKAGVDLVRQTLQMLGRNICGNSNNVVLLVMSLAVQSKL